MTEDTDEGGDRVDGDDGDGWRSWLLLRADRRRLAGLLLAGMFLVLVALGALASPSLPTLTGRSDPVETLFQALVTAVVTGVTLVVTVSQLVLSQELGAVGDQRERMAGAMEFRREAEAVLDEPVAPADPGRFLRALVGTVGDRARETAAAADAVADPDRREELRRFAEGVAADADAAADRLEGTDFGTFDVVLAALSFEYAGRIRDARRLRAADLPDAVDEPLGALVDGLTRFGPAREHVKTLYFQWELIALSRTVVYAAVPALVVSVAMVLFVTEPAAVPGATAGLDYLTVLVAAAVVVALLPFALLLVYILRIVTVAQRTLAIGPFVLRDR